MDIGSYIPFVLRALSSCPSASRCRKLSSPSTIIYWTCMHVGHVGLRAETHGGWFVFADHQSGLPEHVIFKEQVRSTTMLPAIERVGGKTSSGDQQGGARRTGCRSVSRAPRGANRRHSFCHQQECNCGDSLCLPQKIRGRHW